VLDHTGIPDDDRADVEQGWIDYYWGPMKKLFGPKG